MKIFALLLFTVSFAVSANVVDSANGNLLHAEKCASCHDSAMYIRENRIVQSLPRQNVVSTRWQVP